MARGCPRLRGKGVVGWRRFRGWSRWALRGPGAPAARPTTAPCCHRPPAVARRRGAAPTLPRSPSAAFFSSCGWGWGWACGCGCGCGCGWASPAGAARPPQSAPSQTWNAPPFTLPPSPVPRTPPLPPARRSSSRCGCPAQRTGASGFRLLLLSLLLAQTPAPNAAPQARHKRRAPSPWRRAPGAPSAPDAAPLAPQVPQPRLPRPTASRVPPATHPHLYFWDVEEARPAAYERAAGKDRPGDGLEPA